MLKTRQTLFAGLFAAFCAVPFVLPTAAHAKPFKWTSASDIPTWDIHSQNNALGSGVHAAVYESLVYYNSTTFKDTLNKSRVRH